MGVIFLRVNGETQTLEKPLSVADLLAQNEYRAEMVAVEVNEEIIPKSEYGKFMLSDTDTVEIVQFMGGGC